jgi:hypothetical protein
MQSAAAQLRSPSSTVTLNDRNQLPCLGLGVFKAEQAGDACKNAVLSALNLGYRHIDTAQIYQNEEACGQGLKESGISRESVFVTSKVRCCVLEWKGPAIKFLLILLAWVQRAGSCASIHTAQTPPEQLAWTRGAKPPVATCTAAGAPASLVRPCSSLPENPGCSAAVPVAHGLGIC